LSHKNYRGIIFIFVLLIIFFLIYINLLLFGTERFEGDTFASYSNFYYALNCLNNATLPLWDPYTHAGQPFYYQFIKIPMGELSVLFFGIISRIFDISYLMLYNYHYTLHFLIFVFGCFYLAKIIFQNKFIPYYVFFLGLFSPHYGYMLRQEAAIAVVEFLPWLMAFFVLLVTGKGRSFHLFAFTLTSLFYFQLLDFLTSFYFLVIFCILYCILFRSQLSWPRIHWGAYAFAAFLLCLGLLKPLALYSEIDNIFPSVRVLQFPGTKISTGINIASPLYQVASIHIRDYLSILNPLIARYGGSVLMKAYLGFIPAFLAFYAIALRRNKFIWTLAIPAVWSAWVSLGPKAILSLICYYVVPFFKAIRLMENFNPAPIYVGFVLISAFGFESMLEEANSLQDWRKFFRHIQKYLWVFIIGGLFMTIVFICHDRKGLLKNLLVLSYYVIPLIGIGCCSINKNLQIYLKPYARIIILLSATLLLIIAVAIFSRPFFTERLMFFKMNRLIPALAAFYITLSYVLFFHNKKHPYIIAVFCLGVTFIDLIFFTGLATYTHLASREGTVIPERAKPFEYQRVRLPSFWPANIGTIKFLRPAMLYLQSSIITEKKYYSHGSLIFTENKEIDFYMLKKTWDAYQRFPEEAKRIVMGVDAPKLSFFTDYKEMDDEAVFKECEDLNAGLLKHYIYLAPNNHVALPIYRTSTQEISSADIEIEHFDNNRLRLTIDTKESGLLYYSDGYDKNWKCFVDGKQNPVLRANIAFKAVFIPEGRHSVLFVYRPIFYLISFWLFLAACATCLISAYWGYLNRRQVY